MLNRNKIICCLTGAFCVLASWNAAAQKYPQILFKVHDIVPQKDDDGLVNSCSFSTTFYNRTDMDITSAFLLLSWSDEVADNAAAQQKVQEERNNLSRRRRSSQLSKNVGDISVRINLPPLKKGKQITLKNKIDSDKCFLLLGKMEMEVSSCMKEGGNSDKSCVNMFRWVTPEERQYYVEFKEVSVEEEVAQEKSRQEQVVADVNTSYKNVLESIRRVSTSLLSK